MAWSKMDWGSRQAGLTVVDLVGFRLTEIELPGVGGIDIRVPKQIVPRVRYSMATPSLSRAEVRIRRKTVARSHPN